MPFAHKVKEKRKRKKKLKQQQIKTQIKLSHLSDNTAAVAFEEGKQMPSIQTSVCLSPVELNGGSCYIFCSAILHFIISSLHSISVLSG